LLAPRPTPKLEDNPLSAVRNCLFNLFRDDDDDDDDDDGDDNNNNNYNEKLYIEEL